jgi:hypothetical protein
MNIFSIKRSPGDPRSPGASRERTDIGLLLYNKAGQVIVRSVSRKVRVGSKGVGLWHTR